MIFGNERRSQWEHHIFLASAVFFLLAGMVVLMTRLSHVLIPFAVALILSQVINPLFKFLLSRKRWWKKRLEVEDDLLDPGAPVSPRSPGGIVYAASDGTVCCERALNGCANRLNKCGCWSLLWDGLCVGISLCLVIGSFVGLGWGISAALFERDIWTKYQNSRRLNSIVDWLKEHDIEITKEMIFSVFKGPLGELADDAVTFLGCVVITCVFLFFLLIGEAKYQNDKDAELDRGEMRSRPIRLGISRDVKAAVSTYLFLKSALSVGLAGCVGLVLLAIHVDLLFVCIFVVFILNFIPMVGGAMSVALPTVLCFLDDDKSSGDIAVTIVIPTLLHLLFGHIMEPGLFGSALELHPIIVMFSLMIWTVMWGLVGAILSVPLTCCLKIILKSLMRTHPYALFGFCALEFRLPSTEELRLIEQPDACSYVADSSHDNKSVVNRSDSTVAEP